MRYAALPLSLLLAIAQSTLVPHLEIFGVSPDLFLLLTISWVLVVGLGPGAVFGLLGGIVLDGLSGAPFGYVTLSLVVVVALAGLGELNVFQRAPFLPILMAGVGTLAQQSLLMLLLRMSGQPLQWVPMYSKTILPTTLVHLVLMPVVYYPTRFFSHRFSPQRVDWQ